MPDLPTLTVTDAQAQRLLAAFQGQVDDAGQPLTTTAAYRRWLKQRLVSYVLDIEAQKDPLHTQL